MKKSANKEVKAPLNEIILTRNNSYSKSMSSIYIFTKRSDYKI